jgi:hypothetical protein
MVGHDRSDAIILRPDARDFICLLRAPTRHLRFFK